MPIVFISLDLDFINKIKFYGYSAYYMNIEDYKPLRKTYYVSPANSLGVMDGGIDYFLSKIVFPGIKTEKLVKQYGKESKMIGKYLPIGSSIIVDYNNEKSLILSPTMLLPQNVSNTNNAYFATLATMYNIVINKKENLNNIDIVFTSMCCGVGHMSADKSVRQIIKGIYNYRKYKPEIINKNVIIYEPNLEEQPNYHLRNM